MGPACGIECGLFCAQANVQVLGDLGGFLKAVLHRFSERTIVLERVFLKGDPSDGLECDVEIKRHTILTEFLEDIKFIAAETGNRTATGSGGNSVGG